MSAAPREVQDLLPSDRACPDGESPVWPCVWSTWGGMQPIDRAGGGGWEAGLSCPHPPIPSPGEKAEEPGQPGGEPAKGPAILLVSLVAVLP